MTLEAVPGCTLRSMAPTGLRIGVLARKMRLSPDSLRHYERKGLLNAPPRSDGGFRLYPDSAERRVRVVQASLALGFTLDELAAIFAERRRGGAPCRSVRALAGAKLEALEERLKALRRLRTALRSVLRNWDSRLTEAGGEPAGLLEALADVVHLHTRAHVTPRRKAAR